MTSRTTRQFRELFAALPEAIQRQGRRAYRRFQQDPAQPGLRFKRVHETEAIYSARITRGYRAVGVMDGETIVWFWVGTHTEYEKLLARFR